MKPLSFLSIGVLCISLGACGPRKIDREGYSAVTAGMTYDEVEKALSSRPAEIRKGGTVVAYAEDTPEYVQFVGLGTPATRFACLAFLDRVIADSMHWRVPAVRGMGQLAYITWVMPHAPQKLETLQVAIPVIEPDTVYKPAFKRYFISFNHGQTWQEESEAQYEEDRNRKSYGTYSAAVRLKEVDDHSRYTMVINEYGKVSVGFVRYVVESQYCIIFDSLTGRVTEHRFLPQSVRRI